jgi:hypothetical protein
LMREPILGLRRPASPAAASTRGGRYQ